MWTFTSKLPGCEYWELILFSKTSPRSSRGLGPMVTRPMEGPPPAAKPQGWSLQKGRSLPRGEEARVAGPTPRQPVATASAWGHSAWTLSRTGAPAQHSRRAVSAQDGCLGSSASLTPGGQAQGHFSQAPSPPQGGKHGQDAATHLIPGVAPQPGRSSGRLQDTRER